MARRDYFYDSEAPKPNSIRPAVAVALLDSGDHILLLRRKDNDKWTMPGGTLDFGESLKDLPSCRASPKALLSRPANDPRA
jgi:8-oxo-dGTP pyrophosphatase MutT (NUDIX family)